MANGQVKNHSSHSLWVVETDTGKAVAHILDPGFKSPKSVDADGFKAEDGTPIDGHKSWWKINNFSTADVKDKGKTLTRGCRLCYKVKEKEFGSVKYKKNKGWGSKL